MNVGDHGIAVRSKAIGMLEAGVSQKDVALRLGAGLRSIKRWWAAAKCGQSLETKARSGRPKTLNRAAKIVIAKSLEKRRHSTRNIAKSLAEKGYSASSSTVYRHLTKNLGARAFKRPQIPRITERIKENRLLFAHNHKDWTIEDWRKVLWSDESPFELFSTPNRQNDRVWSKNGKDISPVFKVKFPAKVMVWGMMSHRALSELHIIPQKQSVDAAYYRDNILGVTCLDAISRSSKTGSIVERSMLLNMSDFLFMQDGAPAHTAKATQEWCTNNFPRFWKKGEWPANSPDLNHIENLWSILADRVDKLGQMNTIENLIQSLKLAWISIDADILNNLVSGMPDRIRKVIELHGDYIGQ